ncbi:hypothetical protein B0H14DRAFT_2579968 [Mycena olivaceomarginata]|nr:hypothetical protein B0H14DRAFT_2579968 [Mycena olivaceomarginata]
MPPLCVRPPSHARAVCMRCPLPLLAVRRGVCGQREREPTRDFMEAQGASARDADGLRESVEQLGDKCQQGVRQEMGMGMGGEEGRRSAEKEACVAARKKSNDEKEGAADSDPVRPNPNPKRQQHQVVPTRARLPSPFSPFLPSFPSTVNATNATRTSAVATRRERRARRAASEFCLVERPIEGEERSGGRRWSAARTSRKEGHWENQE